MIQDIVTANKLIADLTRRVNGLPRDEQVAELRNLLYLLDAYPPPILEGCLRAARVKWNPESFMGKARPCGHLQRISKPLLRYRCRLDGETCHVPGASECFKIRDLAEEYA